MDRFALLNAFVSGTAVTIPDPKGLPIQGVINSIQREDGSGYRYNVTLYGHPTPIFVQCTQPESRMG